MGADESDIDHLPHDFKVELTDQLAKKNFEEKIIEKFYNHQVNDKQEINKCALNALFRTGDQTNIRKDDKSNSSDSNTSYVSTAENLADIFTSKKPKTMHPNIEELKSAGLTISDSHQEDDEDKMPQNYTEYKEKLEQEERLEFDSYEHFSFLPDYEDDDTVEDRDKEAEDTDLNIHDEECMTEVKDPDLDDDPNISTHHNGICLMQTDRSAAGLNLKNCVLLDSESTVHAF